MIQQTFRNAHSTEIHTIDSPYEIRLAERLAVAHEAGALLVQLLAALRAFKAAGVPLQVWTDAQQPSIQNSRPTAEAKTRTAVFHAEYCHYLGGRDGERECDGEERGELISECDGDATDR